jgi:hypothetical protein
VLEAGASTARRVGEGNLPRDPAWSPDGSTIVYVDDGLQTVTADGVQHLTVAAGQGFSQPRYSPDGARIAYLREDRPNTTAHVVEAAGGATRPIAPSLGHVDSVEWDPTGARLAIGVPGLIYLVDNVASVPRLLRAGKLMSWSPDGRWLAVVDPNGGLTAYDAHTGEARSLIEADYRQHVADMAWAPDSNHVVCAVAPGEGSSRGDVRILPLAAGALERRLGGLEHAATVSWAGYVQPTPSTVAITRPGEGAILTAQTVSVTFEVHADGPWRWRRNGHFPANGQAGGAPGSDGPTASEGLQPGRVYTIRVAAVDDTGDLLSPRDVTSVTFTVTIPADANADGIVDMLDLVYVATNLGGRGDFDGGEPDVDGDGVVHVEDLMLVAAHFGERIAPTAAAAPSLPLPANATALADWTRRAERANASTQELRDGLATLRALLASVAPSTTNLLPNYPNPFNPETWIPFDLAAPSAVTITLYDTRGHRVRTLELGNMPAGRYRERARAPRWDGRNDLGEHVGGGVYIAELRAGSHVERRRLVLLK